MEVEFLTETGVCRREMLFSIGDCRHGGLGPERDRCKRNPDECTFGRSYIETS